jgi:small-conductance mechanosensitive channel
MLLVAPAPAPAANPETSAPDNEVLDAVNVLGDNDVTDLILAAAILLGSIVMSRVAKAIVSRILDNGPTDSLLGDLIGRVVGHLVLAFGLVYAADSLGIAIGPLLGALGVIGIALAFALQSLLENFVAGVLLQIRSPFGRGDEIQSLDHEGEILSIDARTLTLRTPDGETIRLPNAEVIKQPIVNLTSYGRRRTTIEVGVAYGTDIERAARVAQAALASVDHVLATPRPVAQAIRFGPSSIDLALRFWHEPTIADEWVVSHEVMVAVARALDEADITIPFPQRTLHLGDGLELLLGDGAAVDHDRRFRAPPAQPARPGAHPVRPAGSRTTGGETDR